MKRPGLPVLSLLSCTVTGLITCAVVAFVPQSCPRPQRVYSSSTILCATGRIDERCDVAIFGGGFGGLYTALALSREARLKRQQLDVILVDPSDRFVFLPLLYDLVMGTASETEVCPTFQELLEGSGIRHVQASLDQLVVTPDLLAANITGINNGDSSTIHFRTAVLSVGATPQSTLASIPGAADYAQPFYTRQNAQESKLLLEKLERRVRSSNGMKPPRIAIVGGGYGGVELAACVKRRLSQCDVTLLTRGAPMKGTRAEALIDKALSKLGVTVEISAVRSLKQIESSLDDGPKDKVIIERTTMDKEATLIDDNQPWDAVLWTAGSGPAYPVCDGNLGLQQVEGSGRIQVDNTLRCTWAVSTMADGTRKPPIWALGDCCQIVDPSGTLRFRS